MRRRLKQTLENETAFVAGVILLGFLPVALLVAALFVRSSPVPAVVLEAGTCNLLHRQARRSALDEVRPASAWQASELAMIAALARAISRATGTNVDIETLKILVIFSGAGLLVSLVAAMIYGQALNAALF